MISSKSNDQEELIDLHYRKMDIDRALQFSLINRSDIFVPPQFQSHVHPLPPKPQTIIKTKTNKKSRQKQIVMFQSQPSYSITENPYKELLNPSKPKTTQQKSTNQSQTIQQPTKSYKNTDEWLKQREDERKQRIEQRKQREIRLQQSHIIKNKPSPYKRIHSEHHIIPRPIEVVDINNNQPTQPQQPQQQTIYITKTQAEPQQPTYIPISYHYYPSFSYVNDVKENDDKNKNDNNNNNNNGNPPQMVLPSIVTAVDYNPSPPPPQQPVQPVQQPQIIQQLSPPPQPTGPQIIEIKDKSSSILLDYLRGQMDEIKSLKQQATQDQFKAFENKMESFFDKITEKVNNIQIQPTPPPTLPQQQQQPLQYIQSQPREPPIESMIELENKMEQFLTDLTKRVNTVPEPPAPQPFKDDRVDQLLEEQRNMFNSLIEQLQTQQIQYIEPKPKYDEKEDIYEEETTPLPPPKHKKQFRDDLEESKEEKKPIIEEKHPLVTSQIQQPPPTISKSDIILKKIDDDKDLRRLALEDSTDYSELSESDISDTNGELNGDYSDGELYIYRDGPDVPFHDGPLLNDLEEGEIPDNVHFDFELPKKKHTKTGEHELINNGIKRDRYKMNEGIFPELGYNPEYEEGEIKP